MSSPPSSSSASTIEESLIEELKKSLKITENEFLESEIEDLKEFFTVELTEDPSKEGGELDNQAFWLKVVLPINLRTISKEGKENLSDEIPEISIKIKLKNGKLVEGEKVTIEQTEQAEQNDATVPEEIAKEENNSSNELTDNAINTDTATEPVAFESQGKAPLPYEFLDFKVEGLEDTESEEKLKIILKELLLDGKENSLLTVIEDFYIKLEEVNYPHKSIICRDYYYPVFDCRHWGRCAASSKSSNSAHSSAVGGSLNDLTGTYAISYRARALYDFQALMQGELSFQENEVLIVLANLGNGWLTARRTSTYQETTDPAGNDDTNTGLIPENYIERL